MFGANNFYTTSMKVFMSFLLFALLFCLFSGTGIPQSVNTRDPYALITSAYQQGQFLEAEKQLRVLLGKNPSDIQALSLLGVVLDSQQKYEEAEKAYQKAIDLGPSSAALHNNLGNHYLSQGDTAKAQQAYQRTIMLEPRHPNANLQLAQILTDRKEYPEADRRIKQLASKEMANPSIQILQARIYHGMGRAAEARNILAPLETRAAKDLRLTFSLGLAYVSMEQYKEAEDAFTRVLQADPTNFDVLYNLGFAALRGNHFERAEEVFNRALQQKPKDVDSMVGMARTLLRLNKYSQALATMVRASQSAPQRSDILLLMAEGSFKMGFYGDTAIAYDKYLKLKPNDDNARRERGFALARSFRVDEGLQDLEWYVRKHPKEPWGYFELAAAQSLKDANQALKSINMVLSLDPNFHEALYARGMLYLKLERASEAIPDFKSYLDYDPKNVQAMEQMGRALMKINQPGPAAEYLEKAIAQTPDNGNLYFQYSRALRALGRHQEVTEALAKFKQYGGGKEKVVPRPGLYDYLALSPAEQKAEHLKDLQTAIGQRPSDPDIKLRLAEEYLRRGKESEAMALIEQIRSMPLESFDMKVTARPLDAGLSAARSGTLFSGIPCRPNLYPRGCPLRLFSSRFSGVWFEDHPGNHGKTFPRKSYR